MEQFIGYLTSQVESCRDEIADLEKNGCRDEAAFAKVRMNIYEVCKTVTNALMNRPGAGVSGQNGVQRWKGQDQTMMSGTW